MAQPVLTRLEPWPVMGASPGPPLSHVRAFVRALPSAWTALPSPPTAPPSRAGTTVPLWEVLPDSSGRAPPGAICLSPLGAMTVGGWDCVWERRVDRDLSGGLGIWTSGPEGRPLEGSAIDTTRDAS